MGGGKSGLSPFLALDPNPTQPYLKKNKNISLTFILKVSTIYDYYPFTDNVSRILSEM